MFNYVLFAIGLFATTLSAGARAEPCEFAFIRNLHLGAGAIASTYIPKGTLVYSFLKAKSGEKTYLSVQVSEEEHVDDPFLWKLNHSCDPTLYIDAEKKAAFAIRDIKPGELLTFFYPSTEWDMAQPFRCQCGSEHCLGLVQGANILSLDTLQRFPINEHIRRLKETQRK